eukprot:7768073-Alexandrium_andersonii.AAC.1
MGFRSQASSMAHVRHGQGSWRWPRSTARVVRGHGTTIGFAPFLGFGDDNKFGPRWLGVCRRKYHDER